MGPLIDTDVFCKLAVGGLLEKALSLFGSDLSACQRLPALPYMLRRGRLRKKYGDQASDELIRVAASTAVLNQPDAEWLDKLTAIQSIDPGEAQIFALAAQHQFVVICGDKRALNALKDVDEYSEALAGRIVVLEAILIALCDRLGTDELRRPLAVLSNHDKVVQICFSSGNPDPREALDSYFRDLTQELAPLTLWSPRQGESRRDIRA